MFEYLPNINECNNAQANDELAMYEFLGKKWAAISPVNCGKHEHDNMCVEKHIET